jgi:hypothetical protein
MRLWQEGPKSGQIVTGLAQQSQLNPKIFFGYQPPLEGECEAFFTDAKPILSYRARFFKAACEAAAMGKQFQNATHVQNGFQSANQHRGAARHV